MEELDYIQALKLCKTESNELVRKKQLRKFCDEKDLDYQAVLGFIRTGRKKRYPKLVKDFLLALGYNVTFEKEIVFTFYIDKTNEK